MGKQGIFPDNFVVKKEITPPPGVTCVYVCVYVRTYVYMYVHYVHPYVNNMYLHT